MLLIQVLSGIPYPQFGASAFNLFWGGGLSLIVGTIALVITTTLLGWWRPAIFERQRSRHRWPIIAPLLFGLLALANLILTDWASYSLAFFGASLVLLLVGFTEELTDRGLLVVALRSRLSEVWVWFLSSLLFGASHLITLLLGQDVLPTIVQVFDAFLAGSVLYIARRVTGSLVLSMVIHGLWDFSAFALQHGVESEYAPIVLGTHTAVMLLSLAVVPFVIRGANERIAAPADRTS
ncbi:CPBP family intramembrane glutamic endopeptidase [Microbacterium sp. BWT-B31]|uniref:CPBP family intramembrane glutamic endopeptidase n=1 Tax=Microbacterium sp. BWT-B31 TaxID=3232072 RepID=UPI0035289361